ncbi:hypothetical protein O0L34_g2281 [Tuta absoluta]|nr:hypothetical protein O0L34_g2281 [Tuta absoluta]
MIWAVLARSSYMLMIQTFLLRTVALTVTPNVGEFENQLTRIPTKQDYWMPKAIEQELLGELKTLLPMGRERNPEFSRYNANKIRNNMIGNDAYSLDRSVEMTPRERGNIQKKSFSTWIPSCSCESTKDVVFLGEDYSPMGLESQSCSGNCDPPYECKPVYYAVPVLRKVDDHDATPRWVPRRVNITTSCVCVADSVDPNYGGPNYGGPNYGVPNYGGPK